MNMLAVSLSAIRYKTWRCRVSRRLTKVGEDTIVENLHEDYPKTPNVAGPGEFQVVNCLWAGPAHWKEPARTSVWLECKARNIVHGETVSMRISVHYRPPGNPRQNPAKCAIGLGAVGEPCKKKGKSPRSDTV